MVLFFNAFVPVYRFMFHYATSSHIQIFSTFHRSMLYCENRALPDLGIFFVAMPPLNQSSCNCKPCLSSLHKSRILPTTCPLATPTYLLLLLPLLALSLCFVLYFVRLVASSKGCPRDHDHEPRNAYLPPCTWYICRLHSSKKQMVLWRASAQHWLESRRRLWNVFT